jgi:hypothetical protein
VQARRQTNAALAAEAAKQHVCPPWRGCALSSLFILCTPLGTHPSNIPIGRLSTRELRQVAIRWLNAHMSASDIDAFGSGPHRRAAARLGWTLHCSARAKVALQPQPELEPTERQRKQEEKQGENDAVEDVTEQARTRGTRGGRWQQQRQRQRQQEGRAEERRWRSAHARNNSRWLAAGGGSSNEGAGAAVTVRRSHHREARQQAVRCAQAFG